MKRGDWKKYNKQGEFSQRDLGNLQAHGISLLATRTHSRSYLVLLRLVREVIKAAGGQVVGQCSRTTCINETEVRGQPQTTAAGLQRKARKNTPSKQSKSPIWRIFYFFFNLCIKYSIPPYFAPLSLKWKTISFEVNFNLRLFYGNILLDFFNYFALFPTILYYRV